MRMTWCKESRFVMLFHPEPSICAAGKTDIISQSQDRNAHSSPDQAASEPDAGPGPGISKDMDNEQLKNFFSNLMTRKAGGDA
jgi:hypothetical protein